MTPSFEQIRNIIAEQLGIESSMVTEDSLLAEDLGADSIDSVELIMAFETAFAIEIPDADARKLKTTADILRYLKNRIE